MRTALAILARLSFCLAFVAGGAVASAFAQHVPEHKFEQTNENDQYGFGKDNNRSIYSDRNAIDAFNRASDFDQYPALKKQYDYYKINDLHEIYNIIEKNDTKMKKFLRYVYDESNPDEQYEIGLMYEKGRGVGIDNKEAAMWYRRAAKGGDADAQYRLGLMYEKGRGVEIDNKEAAMWYRRAAEQGNPEGQYNLGLMYKEGKGVEKNDEKAAMWFRHAAEQGNPEGQYNLGLMYKKGRGVEKSDGEAENLFRRAAEQGNRDAQYELGLMYKEGKVKHYRKTRGIRAFMWFFYANDGANCSHEGASKELIEIFLLATEQKDVYAQYNLGKIFNCKKDYGEAIKWFRLAAKQGHAKAQNMLGLMYKKAKGVDKNDEEAIKWFRLAAAQGDSEGQYNLGLMYEKSKDVKENNEAVKLFFRSAKQNNKNAQNHLGIIMYQHGKGVKKTFKEAIKLHRSAAKQGHGGAQRNLCGRYLRGNGININYRDAYIWCFLSWPSAAISAKENLTPSQIESADEKIREIEKSNKKREEERKRAEKEEAQEWIKWWLCKEKKEGAKKARKSCEIFGLPW